MNLPGQKPQDEISVDGVTYRNLEFMGSNGEDATFYTDQGPVNVKWRALPEPIRQRFQKEYAEALKRGEDQVLNEMKAQVEIAGKVARILESGDLLVEWKGRPIAVRGYRGEPAKVGAEIKVQAKRAGMMRYEEGGKEKLARVFVVVR